MSNSVQLSDLPLDGEKREMSTTSDRPVSIADLPLEGSKAVIEESLSSSVTDGRVENGNTSDAQIEAGDTINRNRDSTYFSPGPSRRRQKQGLAWKWCAFSFLAVGVLALVIGLSMTLTLDDEMLGTGGNGASVEKVQSWILQNGYSSEADLMVNSSAQRKAIKFMASGNYRNPSSSEDAKIRWMERYALSVLYYSTNGPSWSWLTQQFNVNSLSTCKWFKRVPLTNGNIVSFGATCNDVGRVNSLELFDNGLIGTIPTEISLLEDLETFVLQNNNIRGTIPTSMQRLSKLEYFDCIECQELGGTIPSWIEKWTSLRALGLTGNNFRGTIPTNIEKLTKLAELALDHNRLTGEIKILDKVTSLRSVYLEDNTFSGHIDLDFLKNLENLVQLDISDNLFSGTMPVHLLTKENIEIIDIHDNAIADMPDLIPKIEDSKLEFLSIHGNPISSELPASIINLSNLKHFDATSTLLKGSMPEYLGELTKLTYLFLADTDFFDGPIPEVFKQLTDLRDFSVKDSGRTGMIPNWLSNLSNLILLDLDSNKFTGSLPENWPAKMEFLLVNRNKLSGTIPMRLMQSLRLQILWTDHNEITGNLNSWCESPSFTSVLSVSADCNGTTPLVACRCCDICCDHTSDEKCHDRDRLAQYDPEWKQDYSRRGFYDFRYDFNITRRMLRH